MKTQFPLKGIILLLASGIVYSVIFFPLYPVFGLMTSIFGVIIVISLGWFFGIGIGLAAGLLLGLLDTYFYHQLIIVTLFEDVTGFLFEVGIGGVSGWVGYLHRKTKEQSKKLEKEIIKRKHVEEELIDHRDHFEDLGKERTVELEVEITERKQAEEQIEASLKEKETLLQEIHHRVKNNMAVISSLLSLQANRMEDSQIKEALKDSQSRVYAMSAVHETLHGSENLSKIDLKTYLSKLTSSIFQTYSVNPGNIELNSDIEEVPISIDQASPLGLVINELISNSLKYAFPDERKGEIRVSIKKLDKELELIVMDDGVGIPDGLDWRN